jgi:hypothetical protein
MGTSSPGSALVKDSPNGACPWQDQRPRLAQELDGRYRRADPNPPRPFEPGEASRRIGICFQWDDARHRTAMVHDHDCLSGAHLIDQGAQRFLGVGQGRGSHVGIRQFVPV